MTGKKTATNPVTVVANDPDEAKRAALKATR
jgi:hypothetical protein